MRNIKLLIEYEGTNYAGWQRQNPRRGNLASTKEHKTIQQTLEDAIGQITHEKVVLYGASRTDAGVHAMGQVANFRTASEIPTAKLPHAINAHLPHDIAVKSAEEVPDTFHAQHDAKSKVYRYTVLNESLRCAIFRNFCYY
ncbi:MAG: tRNA pseudouridine synthase A, partial [Candidatus Brocadiales bacterium]